VNEDGTFKVEFDIKEMVVLPYWYGVTLAEIWFDDALQWSVVFACICREGDQFAATDFASALAVLGYQVAADQSRQIWSQSCQTLFNLSEEQSANHILDEDSSYRLFLHLGLSAKQCAENLRPDSPKAFFKLYWNQIRMGGRDPSEVPRRVMLEDALAALGLNAGRVDHSAETFLRQVEQEHAVRLPKTLTALGAGCGNGS
jgi:hypothetical protein